VELRARTEDQAWDGGWYRRAYFDDGTPLGSAKNDECRIDSIAQSWAVLAGADPVRTRQAMQAADQHLVVRRDRLILLFTPPFTDGALEPGYIKGYLPGVRENGGQYTHGALWLIQAYAALGLGNQALELWDLVNPVLHAADAAGVARYKVEPYVVAADVYGRAPLTGRGGWTWYTGSAGWMYRIGLAHLLGIRRQGAQLSVTPCIPAHWPGFEVRYRYGATHYHIEVVNPAGMQAGVARCLVDDQEMLALTIPLVDDRQDHRVRITMGIA